MIKKIVQILIVIKFLLLIRSYCQQPCVIDYNNNLNVPPTGCTLAQSDNAIVVNKLILNGKLIMESRNHLKYNSMQLLDGAALDITSQYEPVIFEDIGNDPCDFSQPQKSLLLNFESQFKAATYDIQSISNQNELKIVNRDPFVLYKGAKVMIIFHDLVEYSEVDRVEGQNVILKTKLIGNYFSYIILLRSYVEIHPKLMFLDQSTIFFKRNCLYVQNSIEQNLYGAVFEDLKGISFTNLNLQLNHVMFIKNSSMDDIFSFFQVYVKKISYMILVGNIRSINLAGDLISSILLNCDSISIQILKQNTTINIIQLSVYRSNLYIFSQSYLSFVGLQFFKSRSYFNYYSVDSFGFSETFLYYSPIRLDFNQQCTITLNDSFFKQSIVDFQSQFNIRSIGLNNINFEGIDMPYAVLLPNTFKGLAIYKCTFISFQNSIYPVIMVSGLNYQQNDNSFVKMYKITDDLYTVYIREVDFVNCHTYQRLISLPFMKLTYDNLYFLPLFDSLFQDKPVVRVFKTFLSDKPLYFVEGDKRADFLLTFTDYCYNSFFQMKINTENGEAKYNLGEFFYLINTFNYKITISLKPDLTLPSNILKLQLSTNFIGHKQTKNFLIIQIDATPYAIKTIQMEVPEKPFFYIWIYQLDKSIELIQTANYTPNIMIFKIEFCNLGQVNQGGQCLDKCNNKSINPLYGQCFDLQTTIFDYYPVLENGKTSLIPCPLNCALCSNNPLRCTRCRNSDANPSNLCKEYTFKQYEDHGQVNCPQSNCSICNGQTCFFCDKEYGFQYRSSEPCQKIVTGLGISLQVLIKCPLNCEICSNTIYCRKCKQGFEINNGLCSNQCNQGYYYDFREQRCVQCSKKNCENQNSMCKYREELVEEPFYSIYQSCQMFKNNGYYFICDGQFCFFCQIKDYSCDYFGPYNFCRSKILESGYFYNRISQQCEPCSSSCQYCKDEAGNCTQCKNLMVPYNGKCECKPGTYLDPTLKSCQLCDSICKECSESKNKCLSCNTGYFLSQTSCYLCDNNCQDCVQFKDNCISCKINFALQNSKCQEVLCDKNQYFDGLECKECKPGTYSNDGENKCSVCDQFCQTCSDTKSTCISCKSGFLLINSICQVCQQDCKECVDQIDKCTSCVDSNLRLENFKCVQIQCEGGQYLDNGVCKLCQSGYFSYKGDNVCKKCEQSCDINDKCAQCRDLNFRVENNQCVKILCDKGQYIENGQCKFCQSGYFSKKGDNTCQKCEQTCKECEDTFDKCTSCLSLNFKFQNNKCIKILCNKGEYIENGACKLCQSGYYSNKGDNLCQKCEESCKECEDTFDKCTSCLSINYLLQNNKCQKILCEKGEYLDNGSCKLCEIGYFSNNGDNVCQKCDVSCKECEDTFDKCTLCISRNFILNNNKCVKIICEKGYYFDKGTCKQCQSGYFSNKADNVCQKCDKTCKECEDLFDKCMDCIDINFIVKDYKCIKIQCEQGYYLDNGLCKQCQFGYFSNKGDNQCTKCDISCKTCFGKPYSCLSCNSGKVLHNNQCYCNEPCKTCEDQIDGCLSCIDPNFRAKDHKCVLIECDQGQYLEKGNCKQCSIGYYSNYGDNMCSKCDQTCKTCSNTKDNCTSCFKGKALKDNKCYCDESCQECVVSVDTCISCKDVNFELDNYKCVLKQCDPGYYLDQGVCKLCPSGYYSQFGDNKCSKCDPICKECKLFKVFCLSCSSEFHELKDGQCKGCDQRSIFQNNKCIQCKEGEFASKEDNLCMKCSEKCKECFSNPEYCTSCHSDEFQFKDNKCILLQIINEQDIIQEPYLKDTEIMEIVIIPFLGLNLIVILIVLFKNLYKSYLLHKQKTISVSIKINKDLPLVQALPEQSLNQEHSNIFQVSNLKQ